MRNKKVTRLKNKEREGLKNLENQFLVQRPSILQSVYFKVDTKLNIAFENVQVLIFP